MQQISAGRPTPVRTSIVERLSSPKNTAAVVQAAACHVTFQKVRATVMFAYVIHCSKHEKLHYGSQIAVVKINFDYRRSGTAAVLSFLHTP